MYASAILCTSGAGLYSFGIGRILSIFRFNKLTEGTCSVMPLRVQLVEIGLWTKAIAQALPRARDVPQSRALHRSLAFGRFRHGWSPLLIVYLKRRAASGFGVNSEAGIHLP